MPVIDFVSDPVLPPPLLLHSLVSVNCRSALQNVLRGPPPLIMFRVFLFTALGATLAVATHTTVAAVSPAAENSAHVMAPAASSAHVVAYVASWKNVTSTALKGVTDAILAFGTTYSGTTSSCENKQCTFSANPIKAAGDLAATAKLLKSVDGGNRRALLSFGGWNMGHCQAPAPGKQKGPCTPPAGQGGEVSCWDYCISAGGSNTADQMVALAKGSGFDGIDLDFESGDDVTATEASFLGKLTSSIRSSWPSAVISHSAMVTMVETPGSNYLQLLPTIKDDLSFVGVQYYNDGPCPVSDPGSVAGIYDTLVTALGGDASKAVVELAISDDDDHSCYDVKTGTKACAVVEPIQSKYGKAFGGVGLWEASADPDSSWTEAVAACVGAPPAPGPTPPPTPPTPTPSTPTPPPTPKPTPTPATPTPAPPTPPTPIPPTPPPTPAFDFSCLADGSGCASCMPGTHGPCKDPSTSYPGSCSPTSPFSSTGCIGSSVNCCNGSPTPAPPAPTPPAPTPPTPPPTPPAPAPTPSPPTPSPPTPSPPTPTPPTPGPPVPTPPAPAPTAPPTPGVPTPNPYPTPSPGENPYFCDKKDPSEPVCRQSVYGTETKTECASSCNPSTSTAATSVEEE